MKTPQVNEADATHHGINFPEGPPPLGIFGERLALYVILRCVSDNAGANSVPRSRGQNGRGPSEEKTRRSRILRQEIQNRKKAALEGALPSVQTPTSVPYLGLRREAVGGH